ncbi:hypothetical protein HDU98_008981 [Podochytrium sp. JEL0797]|nr:hypothetical protein HDU98_008981 [Podochytrium sp. JEL0797]
MLETRSLATKVLDLCGILDRQKLIETFSLLQERNKVHSSYLHSMASPPPPAGSPDNARRVLQPSKRVERGGDRVNQESEFRRAVKSIPSLQGSEHIVDELCDLFALLKDDAQSVSGPDASNGKRPEDLLFRMIHLSGSLGQMCTSVEDRTRLMIASEIGRERNRMPLVS